MKVGDLVNVSLGRHPVKWYNEGHDLTGSLADRGLVIQLSKTGRESLSALVLFENGNLEWIPDAGLEIINESR